MSVQNLVARDPFADVGDDFGDRGSTPTVSDGTSNTTKTKGSASGQGNYIHIRIQQRNGRKTLTTLQGLPQEYDPKKFLKVFKKEFACNGTLVQDEEMGEVIQLQGDQRAKINSMLIEAGIPKATIKVHGF